MTGLITLVPGLLALATLGDGYPAILGYNQRLGQASVLVADLVSEQELTEGQTQNTLEVGFIRSVSEQA